MRIIIQTRYPLFRKYYFFFFFFSSRRRHTRCLSDWSSDVCSSDLISNFNNSSNLQGTGTTIVQITPRGTQSLFALIDAATLPGACPGGIGLTTALAVLLPSRGPDSFALALFLGA